MITQSTTIKATSKKVIFKLHRGGLTATIMVDGKVVDFLFGDYQMAKQELEEQGYTVEIEE